MDVQVTTLDGQRCGCGLEPLLQVDMPDADARGGRRARVLCAACGACSPSEQALLDWFAVHPVVAEDDVEELGSLVQLWLEDITPAGFRGEDLDAARRLWADG